MNNLTNVNLPERRLAPTRNGESESAYSSELFQLLISQWKVILPCSICVGTLSVLTAIALPNMYTATALILPPTKPQSLSTILMGQLGGITGALAPSLGLKDPADLYIGILRSRTTSDDLVNQFNLQEVYSCKTKDETRRKLLDRASFASGKDSMIRLSVQDRDPKRAAALANAFVSELSKQNNRLATTESAQRRLFFEHEVEIEKNALTAAESALKQTQQRTGLVEVGNQAQVVISSISRVRAEIAMQEVLLQRSRMGGTSENPEVARQQTELTALRTQLSQLESGSSRQRTGDPFVPLANVPQAGLEYLRALREMKYHDMLFEVLSKQYEAARIDEAKESPVIQIVDSAITPERKSGPPRAQISILGFILGAIAGGAFVYFRHFDTFVRPKRSAADTGNCVTHSDVINC